MLGALFLLLLQGAAPAPSPAPPPPDSVGFQLGGGRGGPPAPQPRAPAAAPAVPPMNCDSGLEAIIQQVRSIPNVESAMPPQGASFSAYKDGPKNTIYVFTGPGMPAHPAVVRVVVAAVNGVATASPSVCIFGDKSQAQALVTQVQHMLSPPAPLPAAAGPRP